MASTLNDQATKSDRISMINEMFIRTADEDYITARWALANGLTSPFCWLSAHCVEKYLKAVLLANDQTAKGYGHNIIQLYNDVKKLAGATLPTRFIRPEWVNAELWRDENPDHFVQRLSKYGVSDNRYMVFGYAVLQQDLFMLDQLVFSVRRLVHDLDSSIFGDRRSKPTFREVFSDDFSSKFNMAQPLDKCLAQPDNFAFSNAALNRNFPFAANGFPHSGTVGGHSFSEPVILRRILEPLGHENHEYIRNGLSTAKWLLENVSLPKEVKNQIKASINTAEARIKSPQNSSPKSSSRT
tara:strand:- start:118 stop:1011 length:894 start_codon:yes stop_codon:yes gene_type:complete